MTLQELNEELNKLVGEKVVFKRIAANSIIVYFFGEPGDSSVVSVWLDPTWRYERDGRVVLGSGDLSIDESDFGSKEAYETEFYRLCALAEPLQESTLLQATIDPKTLDITLQFSGGQVLRNFANSAIRDNAWTYRNRPHKLAIDVSPHGLIERRED